MNKSESIANLAQALSKAQAEMANPKKTSDNPFYSSKYADLAEVINVSKPILAAHELTIVQLLSFDKACTVETILLHSSGEFISETLTVPVLIKEKGNPVLKESWDVQSIGKTFTYVRRYAYASIISLAQEDDDGNFGQGDKETQSKTPKVEGKIEIVPNTKSWDNAKIAFKRDGNLDAVLARARLSDQNKEKLLLEVKEELTNVA